MIEREARDGVTILRLAHGKASALDTEFCDAITRALEESAGDAAPTVLTGSGSIFSAGVDLKRILDASEDELAAFLDALDRCFLATLAYPGPLVAAVNGHAIAGGCILAAACDHRVMTTGKGRIGDPELLVGVPFPSSALEILRGVLPADRFREAVLRGGAFLPDEALARGFVQELAEADDLMDRATSIAGELGAIHPPTFRLAKEQNIAPVLEQIRRGQEVFDRRVRNSWKSEDTRAAIRGYVERTLGGKG